MEFKPAPGSPVAPEPGLRFLFLDFDGVMNDHRRMRNGYCGIDLAAVEQLERILVEAWGTQIVISSAWRYMALGGHITATGFEYLLNIHGADPFVFEGIVHGFTACDYDLCPAWVLRLDDGQRWEWLREKGHEVRADQINRYAARHRADSFVVLDDMDLGMPELVQTEGEVGLTVALADEVIRRLTACS